MVDNREVFERIYRDYLVEVSALDLNRIKERLGVELDGETAIIPFYGAPYRVSPAGIVDDQGRRPNHAVSVILCKYLLLCPESEPVEGEWVTYREFKDALPFVGGFAQNTERPIGQGFSGRMDLLKTASEALSGRPAEEEISADLVLKFEVLPKIPLLMLFNDRDEDFPSNCSLLFRRSAAEYLDMECLAMVGWVLSDRLKVWLPDRSSAPSDLSMSAVAEDS